MFSKSIREAYFLYRWNIEKKSNISNGHKLFKKRQNNFKIIPCLDNDNKKFGKTFIYLRFFVFKLQQSNKEIWSKTRFFVAFLRDY